MPSDAPSALEPDSFLNFGDLLRYLRRRARVSQRDLSIAVGYNFAHISRLEQGQRLPDPTVIAAVFVPALQLAEEPAWAQRLVALAEAARHGQYVPEPLAEILPETDSKPALPASQSFESIPLLATKLYIPHARPDLVSRPRLTAHASQMLDVPLTLIAAPAGFGKTTLLAAWIAEQRKAASAQNPFAVAWLSIDADDNDLLGFVRYLIAAFQTIVPTIGSTSLALLQSAQPPSVEMLIRFLLNDLATLPEETLLVLDDYHLITNPAIHTALTMLLEHLPPMLHLLLATRVDPPLPLARLRARGQLVELRTAEMRFTPAEAATFLTTIMGLPLNADDVAALETRTEGWIAGLQLAALAMRNRNDLHGFISAFTGSNRFVVDYLATEVFARQPAHIQTFLLQTSILNRLCGSLCDAVMGVELHGSHTQAAYTQTLLEELERANLFLVPLDDERRWYRYHHLFGAMLRERLMQGAPAAEVARLHQRAARWFATHELIDQSIHHALAAGDGAEAAVLVENRAADILKRGDFTTLRGWLDALPESLVVTRPRLCLARARLAILAHELEVSEHWLAYVDQAVLPPDQQQHIQGEILTTRIQIALYRNQLPSVIEQSERALAIIPADHLQLHAEIMQYKASALLWMGQMNAALSAFAEAHQASKAAGNMHLALLTASNYGATLAILARYHAAERHLREVIHTFTQLPDQLPIIALPFLEQASIFYEWNQLDQARTYVEQALERGEQANMPRIILTARLMQAAITWVSGDTVKAQSYIDDAVALAERYNLPARYTGQTDAEQVNLWVRTGNLRAAHEWATAHTFSASEESAFLETVQIFAWARLLIAQRTPEPAIAVLQDVEQRAAAAQQQQFVVQSIALQAVALSVADSADEALQVLERALALAEPENFVRTFVDEGAPMAALLDTARERGISPAYVVRLLAAFPTG